MTDTTELERRLRTTSKGAHMDGLNTISDLLDEAADALQAARERIAEAPVYVVSWPEGIVLPAAWNGQRARIVREGR